jgi:hypothetical protein
LAEKCGKNVDFYLSMWKSPRFWRFFAASVVRMEQRDILFSLRVNSKQHEVVRSETREIVEAHGGHLNLDAECEHTRFVVTLPKAVELQRVAVEVGK